MHDGHRSRMRDRYLQDGADGLEDHELLELALYYAIPRRNTNEIAHYLLNKFSSFAGIFDAPISVLRAVPGVGYSSAIFLKLICDLSRKYLDDKENPGCEILDYGQACDKIALKFVGRSEEMIALMLFDAKGKVIYNDIIRKGTVNSVDLYTRKMVELIVMYNASAALIAHNHPSGLALPSQEDLESTETIEMIFKNMGVNLIDHIIVADGDYVSLCTAN